MSTQIEKKVSLSTKQIAEIGHHVLDGMESAAADGFSKHEIILATLFLIGMHMKEEKIVLDPKATVLEMLQPLVEGYNAAEARDAFTGSVQGVH